MSTIYDPTPTITLDQLKAIPGLSIRDAKAIYSLPCLCLTDGESCVWAFEEGGRVRLERAGLNQIRPTLDLISKHLGVTWLDEYGNPPLTTD